MKKSALILIALALCILVLALFLSIDPNTNINNTNNQSERIFITNQFSDDFENANSIEDIFQKDLSRWHNIQKDDNNIIVLDSQIVYSGKNSIKFVSGKSSGASKADIQREGFSFKKGDDIWTSVWFYIKGGTDTTDMFLLDFEDSTTYQNPGRRIFIQEGEFLASDLGKVFPKPIVFRQEQGKEIKVPKNKWFEVKVHLFLDEKEGIMEVWQDGVKIINEKDMTLPSANAVFDRVQVGITANENKKEQTLYLDDITISDKEI